MKTLIARLSGAAALAALALLAMSVREDLRQILGASTNLSLTPGRARTLQAIGKVSGAE